MPTGLAAGKPVSDGYGSGAWAGQPKRRPEGASCTPAGSDGHRQKCNRSPHAVAISQLRATIKPPAHGEVLANRHSATGPRRGQQDTCPAADHIRLCRPAGSAEAGQGSSRNLATSHGAPRTLRRIRCRSEGAGIGRRRAGITGSAHVCRRSAARRRCGGAGARRNQSPLAAAPCGCALRERRGCRPAVPAHPAATAPDVCRRS